VGNTNTRRALLDVRDLVRALWISAERCEPGEVYNVGGSRAFSVQEVIERIRQLATRPFEIVQEPALTRACDEPVIWGDTTRFSKATGWAPAVDVADTIGHMLEWWRDRLASEVGSR
jgi:nucleoside-diphosphate-sugar epimerase